MPSLGGADCACDPESVAGGILTGKYLDGTPLDSRAAAIAGESPVGEMLVDRHRYESLHGSHPSLRNSVCLWRKWRSPGARLILMEEAPSFIGASGPKQILENLQALEIKTKLTQKVCLRIERAVGEYSESWVGASQHTYP